MLYLKVVFGRDYKSHYNLETQYKTISIFK